MAPVHWSLQVRGRLRPKAFLVDADGLELGRVRRDGRVQAVRAGEATDRDGRTWRVVGPGENLRVSCDGESRATIVDGVLEAGDRAFGWRLSNDGGRTVRVSSATGGGTVLRIDPGDGDEWARIEFDEDLPEAFGVVTAACVRLLEAEDPIWGPGGPGTGGRKAAQAAGADAARRRRAGADTARRRADGADAEGRREGSSQPPPEDGGDGAGTSSGLPGADGEAASPAASGGPAAPLDTQWALYVQGRARPRLALSDGGEDALATLVLRGAPAGALGTATDRDGRRWVAELDGGVVTMRCAGRAMARAEGQELTVGGRALDWQASLEGERTATATDDDGRELLRVRPGPGGAGPWVTVELDDALPAPLAATLASLFVLLRVDALGRRA